MSAATLLGAEPSAYSTKASYAEVAADARLLGVKPCEPELFQRLLFNCAVNNTDDHLRNHAAEREVSLSSYSLNPTLRLQLRNNARDIAHPPVLGNLPTANEKNVARGEP